MTARRSPQPVVFCFGLLEDGNISVGILPRCQETQVGRPCFGSISRQCESLPQSPLSYSARRVGKDQARVLEDFPEFRGGFRPALRRKIGLAAHIRRVEASEFGEEPCPRQGLIVGNRRLQLFKRPLMITLIERE